MLGNDHFVDEQLQLQYRNKSASAEVAPKAVLLIQDDFIPWKRCKALKNTDIERTTKFNKRRK
ncbi:MAG: hypothetical protein ACTHOF_00500 [Flavisolibacter sp.]